MRELLSHPLPPGTPIAYWRMGMTEAVQYDVADQPMDGEMDPFFFLTKDKNFIPHEYPCRTEFAHARRGKRPLAKGEFVPARDWLPFGSPRLDLSGFWFRATELGTWAECIIQAEEAGTARFRLATCGGAILFVNGQEVGFIADYQRNSENDAEFSTDLVEGENEIRVWFDDLAERDARYYIQLDYLDGPKAMAGIPVSGEAALARAIEDTLEAMHFERPAYTGGEVAFHLPKPLPAQGAVEIGIEGDFMSHYPMVLRRTLPAGSNRLVVADVADLPGDFRHFRVQIHAGGLSGSRTYGVEISQQDQQGDAPLSQNERIQEALFHVATRAEPDMVSALAVLAAGMQSARAEQMIENALPVIENCWDCADFALVPLLWSRIAYGDRLSPSLREKIDQAILNYRYWMDEKGNDVQWYFSENHALLFHTAAYLAGGLLPDETFIRSGREGSEQSEIGRDRVRAWLDHFESSEMAEFNSAPYFPIDLKGLTALFALAPDADIRARAGKGITRLIEIVANSAHHGVLTAAQGRSYEHTMRAGRSLELSAIARLIWGKGSLGARFHTLPQMALCLRDHGLEIDPDLARRAFWREDGAQEWGFAQGENSFARLQHYKTRDVALGTAANYRWFDWGYQETLIHARVGENPDAQVWINHPGEEIQSGYGRPSYWGGSASIPRVQHYCGLALAWFDGTDPQPDFTHAWFPRHVFDATWAGYNAVAGQSGNGAVMLLASGPLEEITTGPSAFCEQRLSGRQGWWIVRVGNSVDVTEFSKRFLSLTPRGTARGDVEIDDPEYGLILFGSDGRVHGEGRIIDPADWTVPGTRQELNREKPAA